MANDERQKTVDEALCSLRSLIAGDETIHSGDKIDTDEFHHALQRIAAEIEAAWKRERAEIEAQALSIGGIVESSRHTQKPQGNAAAMREALNKVGNAAAWIAESCNDQQTAKYMNDMIAIVQTALSAPARNCDRYEDAPSAYADFIVPWKLDGHLDDVPTLQEFANWLFAQVAERKGEGDGR